MENVVKEVKTRNKELLGLCVAFIVFQAGSLILYSMPGYFDLTWIMESIVMAVVSYLLYRSYKMHAKNAMKPMIGSALTLILIFAVQESTDYIQWADYYIEWYGLNAKMIGAYVDVETGIALVVAAVCILHYIINLSHHSSPKLIQASTVLYSIYVALLVVLVFVTTSMQTETLMKISSILGILADSFFIGMVIVIERSLDEFRIQRESKIEQ